jgi:glutamate racemase
MTKSLAQQRIGVFDSGVGGLTVLREIYRQLPQETILYFGDTARVPYGNRTPEEILRFVREILNWMQSQTMKMAVMACNTSSALALEIVRSEYNFPILGVILPGAKAAVEVGNKIGVIATPATAQSHAYRTAILEIKPDVEVWELGCPEFVPIVEQNRIYEAKTTEVAKKYLEALLERGIDTLVYGCTHYPHLEPIFKKILPPEIKLVDPAVHVVAAAARELDLLGILNARAPLPTRFCVSGNTEQFALSSVNWLGCTPEVEKVNLSASLSTAIAPSENRSALY